ncbi:hypothetical protein H0H10_23860 [Streptomyces sp. TRM S81-3]|uniref:DUF8175 domain-containing protein n=1 Tax=Streptomyces griseicoloratus TaxID=2752516 RepID=A0A926QRQ8_9ACTN|nr:hypothetical protein [Streptomyces griseicoloratus]MBD0422154.1 hypothetical protein [Streptomyces griseicoloratus]
MNLGDDHQTRTRLPDGGGDVYGGARRAGRSSSRSLVTVVGVVVLLIAAIAFANRGGDDSSSASETGDKPKTSSTAPTGKHPVQSGFAHDEQGAQSAAANYAVALGSDGMFDKTRRHEIVQAVAAPSSVDRLQSGFDADYSADFLKKIGLSENGRAPAGSTFVNRTLPAGTKVTAFGDKSATVEVWCNGLFGLTGEKSTNPVTSSWFTVTMTLSWSGDDWKVLETSQKTGPTPVPGDSPVSGADEMSKAVQEFGGFTYAR